MFTVICYDIAADDRRLAVHKLLRRCCTRVQRSVFEGELADRELTTLVGAVGSVIEPRLDSVRWYRLDAAAVARTRVLGLGEVTRVPGFFVVG